MASAHGLVLVRHPMAIRLGAGRSRPPDSTLALPARTRRYLFFRILLAGLSNPRAHWTARDSSRERVPPGRGAFPWPQPRPVVCAHPSLAFERSSHVDRPVLGRHGRIATAACEYLAARNADDLFCLLPVIRGRSPGFFRLSVGWHAARGGLHFTLLCSFRIPPRLRSGVAAIARQPFSAAVGMVSHLLRVWCSQDRWW